ncbi:hypothetical protein LTR53_019942, partial [Teratosphaeriaceae sp. CCFEE 6253]
AKTATPVWPAQLAYSNGATAPSIPVQHSAAGAAHGIPTSAFPHANGSRESRNMEDEFRRLLRPNASG